MRIAGIAAGTGTGAAAGATADADAVENAAGLLAPPQATPPALSQPSRSGALVQSWKAFYAGEGTRRTGGRKYEKKIRNTRKVGFGQPHSSTPWFAIFK